MKHCPCCRPDHDTGPYRSAAAGVLRHLRLQPEQHETAVEVDRCPGCGGVFLDPGELSKIQALAPALGQHDWQARAEAERREHGALDYGVAGGYRQGPQQAPPKRAPRSLGCPACGGHMATEEWIFGSAILVDRCVHCRGIWLDAGELSELMARFAGWRFGQPV